MLIYEPSLAGSNWLKKLPFWSEHIGRQSPRSFASRVSMIHMFEIQISFKTMFDSPVLCFLLPVIYMFKIRNS